MTCWQISQVRSVRVGSTMCGSFRLVLVVWFLVERTIDGTHFQGVNGWVSKHKTAADEKARQAPGAVECTRGSGRGKVGRRVVESHQASALLVWFVVVWFMSVDHVRVEVDLEARASVVVVDGG